MNIGILIARFQVNELNKDQKCIVEQIIRENDKVLIFLGLSPARVTRVNPLDFETRKYMIQEEFPEVKVCYVKDINDDYIWSEKLDKQISKLISKNDLVTLYGSQESFIDHYQGDFCTKVIEQEVFINDEVVKNQIDSETKSKKEFRLGVVWAAYNQHPHIYPTVDIAIWNKNRDKVLLARKENEDEFRFIGGFSVSKDSYEDNAIREAKEEANIDIENPVYIGSTYIDDWRYKREVDGIITLFFEAVHKFGQPIPGSDVCELKWFDIKKLKKKDLVTEHGVLLEMLLNEK